MKFSLHLGRDVLVKEKEYPEIAFEKHSFRKLDERGIQSNPSPISSHEVNRGLIFSLKNE